MSPKSTRDLELGSEILAAIAEIGKRSGYYNMSPESIPASKPVFGPERPPTGPAATWAETSKMSCIEYQVALKIPDSELESKILATLGAVREEDEAAWRADFPSLECPSEEEISRNMIPHVSGKTKYFFYSNFQAESLTLDFKAANFPTFTHFTEVWKNEVWAGMHHAAPYGHTFAVRASRVFAKRAEGKVAVILPPGHGKEKTWHLGSLWNLELSILMDNPKVTNILRVDVDGNGSDMKAV